MNSRTDHSHFITRYFTISPLGPLMALVLTVGLTPTVVAQYGPEYRAPQDVDGSRTGSGVQLNPGADQTQIENPTTANQLSSEQVFDLLFKEMDNLIPGDFEEGSAQKKAVEDAVTAFQLRDANRVIQIFKDQGIKDPDFPPTDLLLAGLSYATRDPKSARALLERAGTESPGSPAVYAAFMRMAINENRNFDALALLEMLSRALDDASLSKKSKDFYELQYLDGMVDIAMRQQRYSDARAYLTKQRGLIPTNPKVLLMSAELEFKEKNLAQSMEYLKQLQTNLPQTRAAETIIASWFQRAGQPDDARKWMTEAATKYAENPQVQAEVASWAVNEEDFPAASAAIKKAEIGGETPLSKSLKAKIAFAAESYGVAESHYQELYNKNPDNFDVANMYALSLIESNEPEKRVRALEIANRNFRALPENVVAQAVLGYIQLRLGDLEQAKSAIGRALQANSASPEIGFFGASVLREMKQIKDARTILDQALNHKGIFLYRSAANRMLTELNEELPAPTSDK